MIFIKQLTCLLVTPFQFNTMQSSRLYTNVARAFVQWILLMKRFPFIILKPLQQKLSTQQLSLFIMFQKLLRLVCLLLLPLSVIAAWKILWYNWPNSHHYRYKPGFQKPFVFCKIVYISEFSRLNSDSVIPGAVTNKHSWLCHFYVNKRV